MEYPLILHEESAAFIELVNATASYLGIPAVFVEKDYWVTLALKRLHQSKYKADIVFKGGTALSKVFKLIDRFSEDIDLAVGEQSLGDAVLKRLIKSVESTITVDLEYKSDHPLESKHGRFRKTAHVFPTQSDASKLGQVEDVIIVEINALADPRPATLMPVSTLIHDFLAATDGGDLILRFELETFDILALNVERTLCEKILGLVRAGYVKDAHAEFKRRIRHFYDIVMILRQAEYQAFVASEAFPQMIQSVRASDLLAIPDAHVWLDPPMLEAPLFALTEDIWEGIKSEFHGSFKDMVYGDSMPEDKEVLIAIDSIKAGILSI